MLAAFREYILPYLMYGMIFITCIYAMKGKVAGAMIFFSVLLAFPQLWYPTHIIPLGPQSLNFLTVAIIIGVNRFRPANDDKSPTGKHILLLIATTYAGVWMGSTRFNLPAPITSDNQLLIEWKNFAMMLLLYFAGYLALKDEKSIQRFVQTMFIVILVMAWRELANFVAGDTFSYNRRSTGAFWMLGMGANHFAAFIVHFTVPALGLLAIDRNKWRRRLYLAATVASLYPLFYSYSRGAYVAALLAIAVVGALRYRPLLLLLGVFMAFWQVLLPDSVVDRIQTTENENGEMEDSAAMRLVVWELAKQLFSDSPLLGIGFNGFYFASEGMMLRNVHNYYLQVAAEQGLIGCLILGTLMMRLMYSGWRLYRDGNSDFFKGLGLGFIACVTAVLTSNLFGDRFSQLELGGYLWILFGAVDRARMLSKTKVEATPTQDADVVMPLQRLT